MKQGVVLGPRCRPAPGGPSFGGKESFQGLLGHASLLLQAGGKQGIIIQLLVRWSNSTFHQLKEQGAMFHKALKVTISVMLPHLALPTSQMPPQDCWYS